MPTPIIKKRLRVTGGKYLQFNIDPLTLSRIHHAGHVAKLLGIETAQSAIVRAAVKFYLEHLDSVLKKMATLEEDSPRAEHLLVQERYRLISSQSGRDAPKHFPDFETWVASGLPQFGEIIRANGRNSLRIGDAK